MPDSVKSAPTARKNRNVTALMAEEMLAALVENMTWQTNIEDAEREQCLSWATQRFENAVSRSRTDVLSTLRTVNDLLGRPNIRRSDVIKAILDQAE